MAYRDPRYDLGNENQREIYHCIRCDIGGRMHQEEEMKVARFPCKFTPGNSHPGQSAGIPPYKRFFQQMGRGRGIGVAGDDSGVHTMGGLEMAQQGPQLMARFGAPGNGSKEGRWSQKQYFDDIRKNKQLELSFAAGAGRGEGYQQSIKNLGRQSQNLGSIPIWGRQQGNPLVGFGRVNIAAPQYQQLTSGQPNNIMEGPDGVGMEIAPTPQDSDDPLFFAPRKQK